MTLLDILELLRAEARAQTLSDAAMTRAVLLAYELGLAEGRAERTPAAPVAEDAPC